MVHCTTTHVTFSSAFQENMPDERTGLLSAPVSPSTTGDSSQRFFSYGRTHTAWAAGYKLASYCLRYTAYRSSGRLSTGLSILCEPCTLGVRKSWAEIPISFEAAVFKAIKAEHATPKPSVDALKQASRISRKATAIPNALLA
jgi:hypothetical protein